MLFTYSLGFFTRNGEMVRHLAFPLHLILINEVNVRFLFFLFQYLAAIAILFLASPPEKPGSWALAQVVFLVGLYCSLLAACWLASLMGALLPDLAVVLPACFTLLLALSPLFQPADRASHLVNTLNAWNPLCFIVESALDSSPIGAVAQIPWKLALVGVLAISGMRVGMRHLYRELARLI